MAVFVRPRSRALAKPGPGATINYGHPLAQRLQVYVSLHGASVETRIGSVAEGSTGGGMFGHVLGSGSAALTDGQGPYGAGTKFNGTTSYLSIAVGHHPRAWTLAMRVTPNIGGLLRIMAIIAEAPSGTQPYAHGLAHLSTSQFYALNYSAGSGKTAVDPTVRTMDGTKSYQVISTMDGTTLRLYVDGVLVASTATTGDDDTIVTPELLIGRFPSTPDLFFTGVIHSVTAWGGRALTAPDVKWLQAEPFAFLNPPAPKILYFALNTPGTTITGTQAGETDTGNAGVARVTVVGAQAQESDTANAGVARITVVGSQAQEADLGNAGSIVNAFTVTGTQAQESDTGNAGTAVQRWIGSQATETDAAFAGVARITRVGSQATETDTGNTGIVLRLVIGTQATEIDLGNAGTTTGGTVTIHPETGTVTVDPGRRTATVVVTR